MSTTNVMNDLSKPKEGSLGGDCSSLLHEARLSVYRENTFRITGLSVEASEREIRRKADRLRVLEQLGQSGSAEQHAYALNPPPAADVIKAAMQKLSDPEKRIVEEFFWFWPRESGASETDPALKAVSVGDGSTAYSIWSEWLKTNDADYIGQHNLAVLFHLVALDWTVVDIDQPVDSEREEKIEKYWKDAFVHWESVATDERIWDRVKQRIKQLDDPRISSGFARRMAKTLPEAFDKINAEAALKFAQADRMDWAKRHVAFMNETHQGLDDVQKTARLILEPTRKSVEQLVKTAREDSDRDPNSGLSAAQLLLERCRPFRELFELFHGPESRHKSDLFDEVASAANVCVVVYDKATDDIGAGVDALRNALSFATGMKLRELIQGNLTVAEGNVKSAELKPLYALLSEVQDAGLKAKEKLKRIKEQVMPEIAAFTEHHGSMTALCKEIRDACSIVLRGISVEAHNEERDFSTALDAIEIAEKLAVDPGQKSRMAEDKKAIQQNRTYSLCHYCQENASDPAKSKTVSMYGDVQRGFGSVRYRTRSVTVPRCSSCAKKDNAVDYGALAFLLLVVISVFLLNLDSGFWLAAFLGVVCAVPAAAPTLLLAWLTKRFLGLPSDKTFEEIRRLQEQGWHVGDKPSG